MITTHARAVRSLMVLVNVCHLILMYTVAYCTVAINSEQDYIGRCKATGLEIVNTGVGRIIVSLSQTKQLLKIEFESKQSL